LCHGKLLCFEDLGDVALKGFDHPVRAHAVSWTAAPA
jgi:class 3 adenylate cyclase